MEWSTALTILGYVLTLALGLLAIWLKHDRDMNKVREYIARLIGDALAVAVAFAKGNMAAVTDAQLDDFSGGVYDFWVPRLPDGLPGMVLRFYPKPEFQALFRKIWRQYTQRNAAMMIVVKRQ